jgi:putative tRNA adenosine deaminase-associated protein
MPDFDDEEYESFELEGKGGRTPPVTTPVADVDDDLEDGEEDDDEPEDATEDEIDFVLAAYREDGEPRVQELAKDLANDLEELIVQLRRLPGDAGATGFVSLVEEVFVIVRVRGQHVQVLLSDATAAAEWPIARDVADYLGEEIPEEEDEPEPMGDLGILADLGLSDFDLGAILDDLDMGSDEMLMAVADKIKLNPQFRKVAEAALGS